MQGEELRKCAFKTSKKINGREIQSTYSNKPEVSDTGVARGSNSDAWKHFELNEDNIYLTCLFFRIPLAGARLTSGSLGIEVLLEAES